MVLRSILAAVTFAAFGHDCGGGNTQTGPAQQDDQQPQQVWEQVFAKWTCTADGRPTFAFEVVRKSQTGVEHQWTDLGTGESEKASVWLTSVYLLDAKNESFRNFEYKTDASDSVLLSLAEWKESAGNATPYSCTKQ